MNLMILAESGFGKTTSLCTIPEINNKGLDPKETFIISATAKPLPFKGSASIYPIGTLENLKGCKRVVTNDSKVAVEVMKNLISSPYKNIVIDDFNYYSQDYYMAKAMSGGWETPKIIGYNMGLMFSQFENLSKAGKNVIVMAHFESYKADNQENISFRVKVTGNMTAQYITPEGKFDIVLFGRMFYDDKTKTTERMFVTNYDGLYPAKSPIGLFSDLYIKNDLGIIVEKIEEYYK